MKKLVILYLFLLPAFIPVGALHATVLTFDDLPSLGAAEVAPIGTYGGLDWDMNYADPVKRFASTGDIGWQNGTVSTPYVAYNTGLGPSRVSWTTGVFDFNSAYFTSLGVSPIRMNLRGFEAMSLKYEIEIEVNNLSPTLIDANFLGIDTLTITGLIGPTNEPIDFIMDDFRYNEPAPVPEPSTMLLLATGLIGLAGWSRRKFKNS